APRELGRGAEGIEGAQRRRGARLVRGAERLIVVVREVPGLVIEVQLAERAVHRGPLLAELEAPVLALRLRRRALRAPRTAQRPEAQQGDRRGQCQDRADLAAAHGPPSAISRRMRSRVAASTSGGGAAARPAETRLQRRTARATTTRPSASPTNG